MRHKELITVSVAFFGLLLMVLFLFHHPYRAVVDVKIDSAVKGTFQLLGRIKLHAFIAKLIPKKYTSKKGSVKSLFPSGTCIPYVNSVSIR